MGLILIGLILTISIIKSNKYAAICLILFWVTELLFRDYGLFGGAGLDPVIAKLAFLFSTIMLCISFLGLNKDIGAIKE